MRSAEAKDAAGQLKTELEESRQRLVAAREALQNYKVSHNVFMYQSEYDAKLKIISDLVVELAKLDESMAAGTLDAGAYAKSARGSLKALTNSGQSCLPCRLSSANSSSANWMLMLRTRHMRPSPRG